MIAIQEHVGRRIRQYRKARGLTVTALAEQVHKSKSSISKYESGQTVVDIVSLFEIAQVLQINLVQLLDYNPPAAPRLASSEQNPFAPATTLYLYHLDRSTIYSSVLQLAYTEEEKQMNATLFYKVDDIRQVERCDCIYYGQMYNHQAVVSFIMRNYHNAVENVLLTFVLPMRKITVLAGMICGLESNTLVPTAHKMLLAPEPLPPDAELRRLLLIDPATYKEMRHKNALFIPIG